MSTLRSARTGSAVLHREFDFNDWVASPILSRRPTATGLTCRTGGTLVLPIYHKLGGLEPGVLACLPVIILAGRPEEIDPILLLTADQLLGIHIACVHQMHPWQQLTLGEPFMNAWNRGV